MLVQHLRDSMLHIGNLTHLINEVNRNCFRYTSFSCKLFLLSGSIETYYLQTGKLIWVAYRSSVGSFGANWMFLLAFEPSGLLISFINLQK